MTKPNPIAYWLDSAPVALVLVLSGILAILHSYSHSSSGDGWLTLEPLLTFAACMVSYPTRPLHRRLPS